MNNETKKDQKRLILNLVIGIAMLLAGIGMIIAGVIVNYTMKQAFTKWVSDSLAANPDAFPDGKPSYSPGWYIYLLEIGGAGVFLASFGNIHYYFQNRFNVRPMNVKQMCVIGVFSALSVVLYYFGKFNLPFFPSWLDVQFSDVPALLVSFMYGPVSGILTVAVRFFCKLPGTSTVCVGEFADLLIGVTLCLVSGLIYRNHKTIRGALASMGIGMGAATVVACLANWLILIPAYVNIAGFPWVALVGAMNSYMKGAVTQENFMFYYIFVGVLPFNLFRYVLVFIISFLLYKRLHILINHITGTYEPKKEAMEDNAEEESSEDDLKPLEESNEADSNVISNE